MAGIFKQSLNSSDDLEIHYKRTRNYDVRVQDFTPLIGSHIYAIRNVERNRGKGCRPYKKFLRTGEALTFLNTATGAAVAGIGIGLYYLL